jgi:hypothetical protein
MEIQQQNTCSSPLADALEVIGRKALNEFDKAKARALLRGFAWKYGPRFAQAQILAVETPYEFPIVNPETGGTSRTFYHTGRINVILRERGQVKIVKHSTPGESIEPGSHFWDKLTMDTMISAQLIGAEQAGYTPETVIYSAIRKPAISATAVPLLDIRGLKIVLDDYGQRVMNKNGTPRQTGGEGMTLQTRPMTGEEYEQKLTEDIASRMDWYYGAREVARLDSDILEWAGDTWAKTQQILYFRSRDLWPRNTAWCTVMGNCPYFALCAGTASVDGLKYAAGQKGDGGERQPLTDGRLSDLGKCPRLHKLKYEDNVGVVGEDAEGLVFWKLMAAALEAWFRAIQAQQQPAPVQA